MPSALDSVHLQTWKKVFENDLEYIVDEINNHLDTPSFIFLEGEMGVGKTSFVKKFLREYNTSSPSYSVVNDYGHVGHGDFYRLKSADELLNLELELYFENKEYFFGEWGSKYFYDIEKIIPVEWEVYLLEISASQQENTEFSPRNYTLSHFQKR